MMGLGFIWMLLFWGALILLAVWLIALLFPLGPQSTARNQPDPPARARELLDTRYAQGELTRELYEEMRHTLEQKI